MFPGTLGIGFFASLPSPPATISNPSYIATAAESYIYYSTGTTLPLINDGNASTGVIKDRGGTYGQLHVICTFTGPIILRSIRVRGGQFNGNFHYPRAIDIYRGSDKSGGIISTFTIAGTSTADDIIDVSSNSNFSTPSQSYLIVFRNPISNSNYVSVRELIFTA